MVVPLCAHITCVSFTSKNTSHIRVELTFVTSFNLNYLFKGRTLKHSPTLRHWGIALQHMNVGGKWFSPQQMAWHVCVCVCVCVCVFFFTEWKPAPFQLKFGSAIVVFSCSSWKSIMLIILNIKQSYLQDFVHQRTAHYYQKYKNEIGSDYWSQGIF